MSGKFIFNLSLAFLLTGSLCANQWEQDHSAARKPSVDPFASLIEKPKPPEPVRPPVVITPDTPKVKRVQALVLEISAVLSSEADRLALIEYQGQEYLVGKNWDGTSEKQFDGRFSVVEVHADSVVVYDTWTKTRRNFQKHWNGTPGSSRLDFTSGS